MQKDVTLHTEYRHTAQTQEFWLIQFSMIPIKKNWSILIIDAELSIFLTGENFCFDHENGILHLKFYIADD